MKSITELYRIGHGPSSSHTMGPGRMVRALKERYPNIASAEVILYESLAFTGKGHLTDQIIREEFSPIPVQITSDLKTATAHPNTMDVRLKLIDNTDVFHRVESVGGGALRWVGEKDLIKETYPEKTFNDIKETCRKKRWNLVQYVEHYEGPTIRPFLKGILHQMLATIQKGLAQEGLLPGPLKVQRKAKRFYETIRPNETPESLQHRLVSAYAFSVNEENASGGIVVTAPTCGASGTVPSVVKYVMERDHISEDNMIEGLAVAGIIGNLIKHNASISGAEAGCQAEVGSACAMAAALYAHLSGYSIDQIEYAAEVAMEHHLGLTCDPIQGFVQIPCIERNAVAGLRAIDAARMAFYITDSHKISFDMVVATMYQTGKDIDKKYRETSKGGLAKKYRVS